MQIKYRKIIYHEVLMLRLLPGIVQLYLREQANQTLSPEKKCGHIS